jgi:uroporphyrinogen decarboxylase
MHKQQILDHGYILPFVTSRGPLCTAGLRPQHDQPDGRDREKPEGCHKLIDLCTTS